MRGTGGREEPGQSPQGRGQEELLTQTEGVPWQMGDVEVKARL